MDKLILVVNPGSSSRKYAVYKGQECLADLHFETSQNKIICTLRLGEKINQAIIHVDSLDKVGAQVFEVLSFYNAQIKVEDIAKIAIRVVAPSSYFQQHRRLDKRALSKLEELKSDAGLHITSTLKESKLFSKLLPDVDQFAISDSAFHSTIPDYISSYAIEQTYADKLDIKRYGYHGISVGSVVTQLKVENKMAERLVVCHIGSGVSVTALRGGKSLDTTMGYSPLEGVAMATRSGSIDPVAVRALRKDLDISENQVIELLNKESGLLGVSGISSDLRDILAERRKGNDSATLAVALYVHRIQQAIASMIASLGGVDGLVFTGIVGQRSAEIRSLILAKMMYLDFHVAAEKNHKASETNKILDISSSGPLNIYVVASREDQEMARLAEIIR